MSQALVGPPYWPCNCGHSLESHQVAAGQSSCLLHGCRCGPVGARWPKGSDDAMTVLAHLFPTLRDVKACDPFSATALVHWLNTASEGEGSRHAALFLLSVWNPDADWRTAGLKVKPGFGRFNLTRAMGTWDREHRAACLAWVEAPFWP